MVLDLLSENHFQIEGDSEFDLRPTDPKTSWGLLLNEGNNIKFEGYRSN